MFDHVRSQPPEDVDDSQGQGVEQGAGAFSVLNPRQWPRERQHVGDARTIFQRASWRQISAGWIRKFEVLSCVCTWQDIFYYFMYLRRVSRPFSHQVM